jgi:hypothetical protein
MADALFELAQDVETTLSRFGPPRKEASSSLVWAAFNLRAARMGRTIVQMLESGPQGFATLQAIFSDQWDTLEVAAMSLGFEDVTTAIDLCANAVYLATGGTASSDGRFKDLSYWSADRVSRLPTATRAWVSGLVSDPDTEVLQKCREALAHRTLRRHIAVQVGGVEARSLVEITPLATPGGDPPRSLGSIGVLIPQLVAFGETQFVLCCEALKADFKG